MRVIDKSAVYVGWGMIVQGRWCECSTESVWVLPNGVLTLGVDFAYLEVWVLTFWVLYCACGFCLSVSCGRGYFVIFSRLCLECCVLVLGAS